MTGISKTNGAGFDQGGENQTSTLPVCFVLKDVIQTIDGEMYPVLIRRGIGFDRPEDIGDALLAYKFKLDQDQVRLVKMLCRGAKNRQIADAFGLTEEKTAASRVDAVKKKMNAWNRTEIPIIAARYGVGVHDASNGEQENS